MGHVKGKRQRSGRQSKGAEPRAAKGAMSYPRALVILILSLAAFLRFHQLATIPGGLQVDEAMNGSNALEILETGHLQVFYPENNGREGLFINIQTPFVYWFGNTPWALRIPSAIFGVLTVWGVYLLGAELFSTPIGLLASFFVATSFWHLHFSRIGLRAICAPLLLTWGLYFLLAGIRRLRQGKPATGWMILAGAVYGLGFHTYITYRVTPVLVGGMLIYYFFRAREEGWLAPFWKASVAFAAAAALVICPLLIYFIQNPGASSAGPLRYRSTGRITPTPRWHSTSGKPRRCSSSRGTATGVTTTAGAGNSSGRSRFCSRWEPGWRLRQSASGRPVIRTPWPSAGLRCQPCR